MGARVPLLCFPLQGREAELADVGGWSQALLDPSILSLAPCLDLRVSAPRLPLTHTAIPLLLDASMQLSLPKGVK